MAMVGYLHGVDGVGQDPGLLDDRLGAGAWIQRELGRQRQLLGSQGFT